VSSIKSPLPAKDTKAVTRALQTVLVDLIDLALLGKQAHWNVVGPHFRSVHLQLDELVDAARKHADAVAERSIALGANVDGRAETVAADRTAKPMPEGELRDTDAIHDVIERLRMIVASTREQMRATEEPDPPTQDLLNSVLLDLEEQLWMFEALAA